MTLLIAQNARATVVTATWDPNPESNIAGYLLSYGTQSGAYTTTIDVGNVTSRQIDLAPGVRYFFVVQAYNTAQLISPRSAEASIDLTTTPPPLPPPPPPTPTPTITSLSPGS